MRIRPGSLATISDMDLRGHQILGMVTKVHAAYPAFSFCLVSDTFFEGNGRFVLLANRYVYPSIQCVAWNAQVETFSPTSISPSQAKRFLSWAALTSAERASFVEELGATYLPPREVEFSEKFDFEVRATHDIAEDFFKCFNQDDFLAGDLVTFLTRENPANLALGLSGDPKLAYALGDGARARSKLYKSSGASGETDALRALLRFEAGLANIAGVDSSNTLRDKYFLAASQSGLETFVLRSAGIAKSNTIWESNMGEKIIRAHVLLEKTGVPKNAK